MTALLDLWPAAALFAWACALFLGARGETVPCLAVCAADAVLLATVTPINL